MVSLVVVIVGLVATFVGSLWVIGIWPSVAWFAALCFIVAWNWASHG